MWLALCSSCLYFHEVPGTHWVGGSVGLRAALEVKTMREPTTHAWNYTQVLQSGASHPST